MKFHVLLITIYLSFSPLVWGQCGLPHQLTPTYTPRGVVLNSAINGMDVYETGRANATKILIVVFDIYGFTPPRNNVQQISDHLGDLGYRVVIPDWFHGEPWRGALHPGPENKEYIDWSRRSTSWNASVKEDLGHVLATYKAQNVTEFGLFGFCFGGKIAAHAVDEYYQDIKVAAQYHPSGATVADAALIKSPSILLPGSTDPDMTQYCAIINTNLGNGSCVYNHFRDVPHGYSGGTADWSNLTIRTRAQEALALWEGFLCEKFPV